MRPTELSAIKDYLMGAEDIPYPARDAMWRLIDEVKRLAKKLEDPDELPKVCEYILSENDSDEGETRTLCDACVYKMSQLLGIEELEYVCDAAGGICDDINCEYY
jgi:hypothetical protein